MQQISYYNKFNPKILINKMVSESGASAIYSFLILLFIPLFIIWAITTNLNQVDYLHPNSMGLNLYAIYRIIGISYFILMIISLCLSVYELVVSFSYNRNYKEFINNKNSAIYEGLDKSGLGYFWLNLIFNVALLSGYIVLYSLIDTYNPMFLVIYCVAIVVFSIVFLVFNVLKIKKDEVVYSYYQMV